MTLYIDPVSTVFLAVSCAVGYFVYKHTRQGLVGKGDIVGAIVCATAVLTALVLIVGGAHSEAKAPGPAGTGNTVTTPPAATPSGVATR